MEEERAKCKPVVPEVSCQSPGEFPCRGAAWQSHEVPHRDFIERNAHRGGFCYSTWNIALFDPEESSG